LIKDWNFNWQGDYRYAKPIFLPRGTALSMQFTYDNSVDNVRNPNHPPKPVRYGVQTTDEMGELWFQVLPRDRAGLQTLSKDIQSRVIQTIITYNQYRLRLKPDDARAHARLGQAFLAQGRTGEA